MLYPTRRIEALSSLESNAPIGAVSTVVKKPSARSNSNPGLAVRVNGHQAGRGSDAAQLGCIHWFRRC